ncbi:MAG: uroporphyrinogen-III synthase [Flavobacteriales bacterium]|nr:uroporphyrinogen-III synthase [Flavobacteriales bacterium]MCX7768617.1 uroporphyrinogen-III synthase [Flavobacteriales bacterium]MDW8409730.1 uroporphyrinogen-III synthase [Flavobacteriales bacterium]
MKVKSILISQPKPESEKNPYAELEKKYNVKIDFRPFIYVEGVDVIEFRKQRINILEHQATIFNSRYGVDNFFRLCKELRITMPDDHKYFCSSEAVALYLQKYIVYRKRKIFHGQSSIEDLVDVLKRHKNQKMLVACGDTMHEPITGLLDKLKIQYSKATLYHTRYSDLSDLNDVWYDMLVFFSPAGIESLFHNFPGFKQENKVIGTFGPNVRKAAEEHNLVVECYAPTPEAPSMTTAIDNFLKKQYAKK